MEFLSFIIDLVWEHSLGKNFTRDYSFDCYTTVKNVFSDVKILFGLNICPTLIQFLCPTSTIFAFPMEQPRKMRHPTQLNGKSDGVEHILSR